MADDTKRSKADDPNELEIEIFERVFGHLYSAAELVSLRQGRPIPKGKGLGKVEYVSAGPEGTRVQRIIFSRRPTAEQRAALIAMGEHIRAVAEELRTLQQIVTRDNQRRSSAQWASSQATKARQTKSQPRHAEIIALGRAFKEKSPDLSALEIADLMTGLHPEIAMTRERVARLIAPELKKMKKK